MIKPLFVILLLIFSLGSSDRVSYCNPYYEKDFTRVLRDYGMPKSVPFLAAPTRYPGVIIGLRTNAQVLSMGEGIVTAICDTCTRGKFGHYVQVSNEQNIRIQYYHLKQCKVKVGDTIKACQAIGVVGNSGLTPSIGLGIMIWEHDTLANPIHFMTIVE